MQKRKRFLWVLLFVLAFVVMAGGCGGGGGNGSAELPDPTPTPDPAPAAPTLTNLDLSAGTLVPAFSPDVTQYAVNVDNTITSVAVTATTAYANASITVNNVNAASGVASAPISLNVGPNSINVTVASSAGSTSYNVIATRAAEEAAPNPEPTPTPGGGDGGAPEQPQGNLTDEDIDVSDEIITAAWDSVFTQQNGERADVVEFDDFVLRFITELKANKEVVSAQYYPDRDEITVMFDSGYETGVVFYDEKWEELLNAPTAYCSSVVETGHVVQGWNPSAAIDRIFDEGKFDEGEFNEGNKVESDFDEALESASDTGDVMDRLRYDLDSFDFIALTAHGRTSPEGRSFNGFVVLLNKDYRRTNDDVRDLDADLITGHFSSCKKFNGTSNKWEVLDQREEVYTIWPEFFTAYYKNSKLKSNVIFYLSICASLQDHAGQNNPTHPTIPKALMECGANTVIGFDQSVSTKYATEIGETLATELLSEQTVQAAIHKAQGIHGDTDPYHNPAAKVVIVGNDNVALIESAPIINTSYLEGIVGISFNQTLVASGSTTITWEIASGVLPEGLELNPSTGVISGIPITAGTSNITVRATNSAGRRGTKNMNISIAPSSTQPPTGDLITRMTGTWRPVSVNITDQPDADDPSVVYEYNQISPVKSDGTAYSQEMAFTFPPYDTQNNFNFDYDSENNTGLYVVNNSYADPNKIRSWDPSAIFNVFTPAAEGNRLVLTVSGTPLNIYFELLPTGQLRYYQHTDYVHIETVDIVFERVE